MSPHREARARSIVKALTWRVVATIVTLTIIYYFTGTFWTSVETTLFVAIFSTIAYYIHERAWNKVSWGRN